MADPKKPVAAPVAPVANPAPAAPAAPEAKPEKVKKPKTVYQTIFDSAEAATKEAADRTKGPRRAFKTTLNGVELFVVANNEGRAGGVAFEKAGGKVEELGKTAKVKPAGVDAILSMLNALPPEERAKVEAAMKGLTK